MTYTYGAINPLTNATGTIDGFATDVGQTVQIVAANGTQVGPAATVAVDHSFTIDLDPAFQFHAAGDHLTFFSEYTDGNGRISYGPSEAVTYDPIPPVLTITSGGGEIDHDKYGWGSATLTGQMTAPFDAGRTTGTLEILDAGHHVGLGVFNSDGSWSATVTLIGNGAHVLTAQSEDEAGNLGTSAPVTVTIGVFGSYAHDGSTLSGEVYALYDGLLGRAPDSLGLEGWVDALSRGTSLKDVAQGFLNSQEGQARAGALDNAAFVEQLYGATLHRHSDPAGLASWTDQLDHGAARGDVALGFALSPEHLGDLQGAFNAGIYVPDATVSDVARLYYTLLDRAPDAAGLAGWTNLVKHGTSLEAAAQGFLNAPETQAKTAGLTSAQFVDWVYENALGRHAEPVGLAAWTDSLDHGGSRVSVAVAIGESQEAHLHLAAQIESGWHLA